MHRIWLLLAILTAVYVNSYEECAREYCPPSMTKPKELPYGNSVGDLIGRDQKTGCYCRDMVPYFELCYGRSSCTSMPKSLPLRNKVLKITNTHINKLLRGDFEKLGHLVDLQIEGNYDLEIISSKTFQNLNNLTALSICFNTKLRTIQKDTFLGLSNLKRLFLNNNALENLYDISLSLRPAVVPKLLSLILDSNSFLRVGSRDFAPMENSALVEISLVLCRIEYIHPDAMFPLKNLQGIQLGENSINSEDIANMLENMFKAEINLKTLHFFYMGFKKIPPRSIMDAIAKTNVSYLNLSKNQFEVLTRTSFPLMPKIEILDLRETLTLKVSDDAFINLPNLKTLLISGNKLSTIPKGVLMLRNLTFLDMQENSPSGNSHLYFDLKNIEFRYLKSLVYLNIGFNGLSHLYNTSFIGLQNLRYLELKNSSIFHAEKDTFVPLKELKVLNLVNNLMDHGEAVPDVFFSLKKLEILLLGGCGFRYITLRSNPFRNLHSLKYLGLEKNLLSNIAPTDFQSLISVRNIDLSFNLLNSWDERIVAFNRNLTELSISKNKITDITLAMFEDFATIQSVDLDQNAVLCRCFVTYRSYKKWQRSINNAIFNQSIFKTNVHCAYSDTLNNVTLVDFLTKPLYGRDRCNFQPDKIYLLLPFVCLLLFFATLGGVVYYYRWHIKYWIFLSKLYLSRTGKIKPRQETKGYSNYEYDAFVSYSTEDRDFVVNLVTMMENQEPYLRLCVYERDFLIGTIISESVLESVAKSRKTVLIISDNYAKSQWCRWESQICEHHRLFFENESGEYVDDTLVLIRLGPVSESHLTPTLKYLLKTRIYLQWEWDERKQGLFWTKLKNTLGPSVTGISCDNVT